MGRAPCCDKANVKKGPWSPEEDAKLKSYIEQHGTGGNWIALPQKIGLKRCGKSCRLRWLNYLRPNIKHGGFSEEEDNIICSLYISIGSRWSIIAAQLPGRTDNDIKNYWNTRLKKKLLGKPRKDQRRGRRASAGGGLRQEAAGPDQGESFLVPNNADHQNPYFWHEAPALMYGMTQDHHCAHQDDTLNALRPLLGSSNAYRNPMCASSSSTNIAAQYSFGGGPSMVSRTAMEKSNIFTTELDEILYSNPMKSGADHSFYGVGTTLIEGGGGCSTVASSSESLSGSWNDVSPLAYSTMPLVSNYLGLMEQHCGIYDQEVQLATLQ